MSKLREFLTELGTNSRLLKEYKKDPDATMESYGLTKEEIKAVKKVDMDAIKELTGYNEDYEPLLVVHNVNEHGM